MKTLFLFVSTVFLSTLNLSAEAALDTLQTRSIFEELYQPGHIIEVSLKFDCKKFIRNKKKQDKFPGTITYQRGDSTIATYDVNIKSRGKTRLDVCDFPPIKLDFDKKSLRTNGLNSLADELKLVTHCRNNDRNNEALMKEYLTYILDNIIDEHSYRVQLLHVRYLNNDGDLYTENMAFLIEPTEILAQRLNCRPSEARVNDIAELEPTSYYNLIMFEYMIGNVDWDIKSQHNIKILLPLKGGARVAIPYDFDFSGMVKASYAGPQERVDQKYVGQRILMGEFSTEEAFSKTLHHFLDREDAIMNTCQNFLYLDDKDKAETTKYLKDFFKIIKNPKVTSKKL